MKLNKEVKWLLEEKYGGKPDKGFLKDVQRLNKGEPLDYVIGFTEFGGAKIDLSKKPLIPRQETEFWVGEEIKKITGKNLRILDVFSGSGCIGIAVLKNVKSSKVFFADKSLDSVKQIKINLKINKIKGRVVVRQSDIFSNVKGKFDYIFANPPYVAEKKRNKVQKSALKFEPEMALFGGQDGLFYIKKFLRDALRFLRPGGKIFLEFSPEQKKEIEKIFKKFGYRNWEFKKDQFNRYRWVKIFAMIK